LQIGDASGIQSPLSFGGFGAITRHIQRLTDGISDALDADLLSKRDLAMLNPYQVRFARELVSRSMEALL
jgi:lycopene cyclase CruP